MFPNKFAVYLHDTPSRRLFEATSRGYSSGCIRVERPVWLAEFVLKGQDEWSFGQIEGRLNSGEKQTVQLRRPIDVHLLYWTAWVSDDGVVHFRDDIYGRDLPLATALSERLTIG
jgi:murein L,D-transpeptidase YcbB/YkuD